MEVRAYSPLRMSFSSFWNLVSFGGSYSRGFLAAGFVEGMGWVLATVAMLLEQVLGRQFAQHAANVLRNL